MQVIKHCLNQQLTHLGQQSIQLEVLYQHIKQLLAPKLAVHCQVGSFNKGCLVLTTTDAVWASELRYAIPELRDRLRKEAKLYQLSSIKIMVVDAQEPFQKAKTLKTKPLSDTTRNLIIRDSQACTYQPLREALLQLAEKG